MKKVNRNITSIDKKTVNEDILIIKEISRRVTRIVVVMLFFTLITFVRSVLVNDYNIASLNKDYLLNSLQVTELTKGINREDVPSSDVVGSSNDGYVLEVSNSSNKDREVTFVAENTLLDKSLALDYKYVRYQIICNDDVVLTSNISEDGVLYKTTLDKNSKNIYEIKFWIDENAVLDSYGKKFSVKITLI